MHTTFDLRDGVDLARFRAAWDAFLAHLQARDLVVAASPIAERRSDTGLDTDDARPHGYFVVMSFRDRAQSEAAWDAVAPRRDATEALHLGVFRLVSDPIFACWEDTS